jgi:hypothetical protein
MLAPIRGRQQSGNDPQHHVADAGKMIALGKGDHKLARERVRDRQQAIRTHKQVGKEGREPIKRIGGPLPENILPAEHITLVEKRVKTTPPKLELDETDSKWLVGPSE